MNSATGTRLYSLSVDRTQPVLIRPISSSPSLNAAYEFERYIVDLFEEHVFHLLEWRSDKETREHRRPESCFYPDMEFEIVNGQQRFALKCVWQQQLGEIVKLLTDEQLAYYKQYQHKKTLPVFIALGKGGNVSAPEQLFIIPLDILNASAEINRSALQTYGKPEKARFCTALAENRFKFR